MRETRERAFGSAAHSFKSSTSFGASVNDRLFSAMKESIMLSIFAVRSTRGMSLGAGGGSRSLAGLSCLGGGGGGLNRGKREGGAFFWENWAPRV